MKPKRSMEDDMTNPADNDDCVWTPRSTLLRELGTAEEELDAAERLLEEWNADKILADRCDACGVTILGELEDEEHEPGCLGLQTEAWLDRLRERRAKQGETLPTVEPEDEAPK